MAANFQRKKTTTEKTAATITTGQDIHFYDEIELNNQTKRRTTSPNETTESPEPVYFDESELTGKIYDNAGIYLCYPLPEY